MHANAAPEPDCELYAVELQTEHWAELVAWYRDKLGLRVLVRAVDDQYALLAAGTARLAILGRGKIGVGSPRSRLVWEVADLESFVARLRAADVQVTDPRVEGEGFREARLDDPDGNRLQLFEWPKRAESSSVRTADGR